VIRTGDLVGVAAVPALRTSPVGIARRRSWVWLLGLGAVVGGMSLLLANQGKRRRGRPPGPPSRTGMGTASVDR
jgi:hypothetical protein